MTDAGRLLEQMLQAWVDDIDSVDFPAFAYPEGPR